MNLSKKNYEIITEELQRIIESGLIKPGEKMDTIENLAKQYYVSRSTIREALSHLKAMRLIESRQGGGIYVKHTTLQSLSDIDLNNNMELTQLLQVRKIIEVGCIELASELRTSDDLAELKKIVQQMRDCVGNEELSQIYDINFHFAIAKATKNPFLQMMMESISSSMTRTIRDSRKLWLYTESKSASKLFEEHNNMLKYITNRDSKSAVDVMREHLAKVESVMRGNN
ncbi:FadR/GntR family transcriptional regulator [Ammoniphilus sp. 3BR4]|uniref:FadR/GntR family transcriptional regulator n=1 Tax=Ammoniphilus sp. 3BR4 TaxID=3158265 RepID=UPI003467D6FE